MDMASHRPARPTDARTRAVRHGPRKLGLNPAKFAIYWHLQGDGIEDALPVASEIMAAATKYPNHRENDDERRQLKSEIYRSLMTRGVDGAQMVRLGDAVCACCVAEVAMPADTLRQRLEQWAITLKVKPTQIRIQRMT